MLLIMPASVPRGPPGVVPGMSWVPKMAYDPKMTLKIMNMAIMMYLNCPSAAFVFSERFKCLLPKALRIRVNRSMYKPKGHSQPQKNLPSTMDMTATNPRAMNIFSKPEVE
jgi:hypothetical protein